MIRYRDFRDSWVYRSFYQDLPSQIFSVADFYSGTARTHWIASQMSHAVVGFVIALVGIAAADLLLGLWDMVIGFETVAGANASTFFLYLLMWAGGFGWLLGKLRIDYLAKKIEQAEAVDPLFPADLKHLEQEAVASAVFLLVGLLVGIASFIIHPWGGLIVAAIAAAYFYRSDFPVGHCLRRRLALDLSRLPRPTDLAALPKNRFAEDLQDEISQKIEAFSERAQVQRAGVTTPEPLTGPKHLFLQAAMTEERRALVSGLVTHLTQAPVPVSVRYVSAASLVTSQDWEGDMGDEIDHAEVLVIDNLSEARLKRIFSGYVDEEVDLKLSQLAEILGARKDSDRPLLTVWSFSSDDQALVQLVTEWLEETLAAPLGDSAYAVKLLPPPMEEAIEDLEAKAKEKLKAPAFAEQLAS